MVGDIDTSFRQIQLSDTAIVLSCPHNVTEPFAAPPTPLKQHQREDKYPTACRTRC